jgi:hypothetical protein
MMQNKYIVEMLNDDKSISDILSFRTRSDISKAYRIPVYIVDKLIERNAFDRYKTKVAKPHKIYTDVFSRINILLIKPTLNN